LIREDVRRLSPFVSVAMNEQKRREREAREMFDYFMSQKGSLVEGYVFSREDANARQ